MAKKIDNKTGEIENPYDVVLRPDAKDVEFGDEVPTQLEQFEELTYDEILALSVLDISDVEDVAVVAKESLIATPFIVLDWVFRSGTFGEFVLVKIKTKDNKNAVFSDGGSGIKEQLERYHAKIVRKGLVKSFQQGGMVVPNGLRVSRYTFTQPDGSEAPAETFYLDTAS